MGHTAAATVITGAVALTSFAAMAQQAGAPSSTSEAPGTALESIVVTGTRIQREGFESPTPVTVLSADSMSQRAPTSLPDALNQLPVFLGSVNGSSQSTAASNVVRTGNYLNLRALGTQRVLVLQDGQRLPPTGNNGGTDANLVPQMLIERVEIVTGGASAAYGSDAVSGVVNFIVDNDFRGFKATAQVGQSSRNDNEHYRVGVAVGNSFLEDRLHVIASAEHFDSQGIGSRAARSSVNRLFTSTGTGTAANPIRYVENTHYATTADGGYILNGPLAGRQFLLGGITAPFTPGTPTGRAGLAIGGDGSILEPTCCSLSPEIRTTQLFGRGQFEFTDDVSGFLQVSYGKAQNWDTSGVEVRFGSGHNTIYADNAFLSDEVRNQLGATPSFNVSRAFDELGGKQARQDSRSFIASAGLKGTFAGDRYRWDVRYLHGRSTFESQVREGETQRYYAALDAVRSPSGEVVCRVTLTNPGLHDNCVPLNIFGLGAVSPQATAYYRQLSVWDAVNEMDSFSVNLSGEPVELWAGPVSLAVGAEYREQSLEQTSNSDPGVAVDFTGIRGVPGGAGRFLSTNTSIADGSYNIKEAYAEIAVPLAKDVTLARALELNGAFRYTDYSTSGAVETYKIGTVYEPIADVRFRGTYSRDIRAPSLFELFSGRTSSMQPISDELTNQFVNVPMISGGNPELDPEIATTWTAGLVLTPSFLPGFSASLDYYQIEIEDAIASPFTATQILDICAASGYTNPICNQVVRPLGPSNPSPQNVPTAILLSNVNIAKFTSTGLDIELSYRRSIVGGQLSVRALGTRLFHYTQQNAPGQSELELAGTADFVDVQNTYPLPKWRANAEISYATGPLTLSVQERMIGGYQKSNRLVYQDPRVGSVFYTDASISYDFDISNARVQAFLTVNNLFDRQPPLIVESNQPGFAIPTYRHIYDIIGRYVTIGAKVGF